MNLTGWKTGQMADFGISGHQAQDISLYDVKQMLCNKHSKRQATALTHS
jgi:hypothetical protein